MRSNNIFQSDEERQGGRGDTRLIVACHTNPGPRPTLRGNRADGDVLQSQVPPVHVIMCGLVIVYGPILYYQYS